MKALSHLAETLPVSGIRAMMRLAAGLEDVVHLEVGEPSFPTPAHIVNSAFESALSGRTGYTPSAGLWSLREAVAMRMSLRWDRNVAPSEVLISTGAVGALVLSMMALVDEGDEVLLPEPGWPNYASIAAISRAKVVRYTLDAGAGFLPDPDEIEALISQRTKLLVINNPGNPTGAVFPEHLVRQLVAIANRHGIYLVADEVYEDLVFDSAHVSAGRFSTSSVHISGCSKTFAMTGWRIGFAVAPPFLIDAMEKLQEPLVSCASAVSQHAAEAAITGPQQCVEEMRRAYHRRRDLVVRLLRPAGLLPVVPGGAFYALVDLSSVAAPFMDLAQLLLKEARVATAPGATFGASTRSMVRISLAAADDDLIEGCRRIIDFVESRRAQERDALVRS